METSRKRQWVFIYLHSFLVGCSVDSSSPSSSTQTLSITSKAGNQAVLPCSWKQRLGHVAPPTCHVQWTLPGDTVFEQRGTLKWQAEEFEGRAEVPEERLGHGDCSLIISDVQVGDAGRYEGFMVVDGVRSTKTRVFIQSVKLSVIDHKSINSRGPGEDLVLDLYTPHSMSVVFRGWNSSEWSDLWMRSDDVDGDRLEKNPQNDQLTIKKLRRSDGGTYKVLDEYGLTVSTVQLFVEETSTPLKVHQHLDERVLADAAVRSSCSALLITSALVTTFQVLRLT